MEITFRTHFYKWNGRVYRQSRGGPIGLRATGSAARGTMWRWRREFGRLLEENGVEVHLLTYYVDNVVLIAENLRLGSV